MRFWVKIGLFLSAYFPFFLILAIRNSSKVNLTYFLVFIIVYSLITWGIIYKNSKNNTGEFYTVSKVENKTNETLNYLAPYIIAFLNFDLTQLNDIVILIIFLVIVFAVYVSSNLIYMNPLLVFFKRKIYRVEVCKPLFDCDKTKREILLIDSDAKLHKGDEIHANEIDIGVLWR